MRQSNVPIFGSFNLSSSNYSQEWGKLWPVRTGVLHRGSASQSQEKRAERIARLSWPHYHTENPTILKCFSLAFEAFLAAEARRTGLMTSRAKTAPKLILSNPAIFPFHFLSLSLSLVLSFSLVLSRSLCLCIFPFNPVARSTSDPSSRRRQTSIPKSTAPRPHHRHTAWIERAKTDWPSARILLWKSILSTDYRAQAKPAWPAISYIPSRPTGLCAARLSPLTSLSTAASCRVRPEKVMVAFYRKHRGDFSRQTHCK